MRVRPLQTGEYGDNEEPAFASSVYIQNSQALTVSASDGKRSFQCSFDAVLGPESAQSQVYTVVRGCTESVLNGFNRFVPTASNLHLI